MARRSSLSTTSKVYSESCSAKGPIQSSDKSRASPLRQRRAHEIALADLHAALPDDVVGGRGVKEEVRQAVAQQQSLPLELSRVAVGKGDADILLLGAVDLRRLHAFEEIDGLG